MKKYFLSISLMAMLAILNAACSGGDANDTPAAATATAPTAAFTFVSASGSTTTFRSGWATTFADASSGSPTSWLWTFGDGATSTLQNPTHIYSATGTFTVTLKAANALGSKTVSRTVTVIAPEFNMASAISDGGQSTTLAFAGLAMITGNLDAQSFFPPGKVADYTGFQYLRDNDPGNMGHNTSFLTRVAYNVIYILTDSQLAQLAALAATQQDQVNLYGYKRFVLMQAFRRLLSGTQPSGKSLSLSAVKAASNALYRIDGQIAFDRALLYATILSSMNSTQLAYLDAMKGKGFNGWPDITQAQVDSKLKSLPAGSAVLVMTYAGDLFSWYAGSLEADVYFCPERHGTYFGSFYIKDAPAIGHEGYGIDEQLTAEAGSVLLTPGVSPYNITTAQAALMNSLVDTQRSNLYTAGSTSIVGLRTQIATLLRSLLTSTASSSSVNAQVLTLSGAYGDLDGENNYHYANIFTQVYGTLSNSQKTALASLRQQIMSGTWQGVTFDYSVCTTPFLYSGVVAASDIAAYISDTATDLLFE